MFTQLHAMAQAAMLLITATADGDQLRISITPSYPDGKVPAGATALRPLSLVGTPDELNADFGAVLAMWQAPKRSILEQAQDQVDEQDDDADAPKATSKATTKSSDAKPKKEAKPVRKSTPAAAATQDNASTQPLGESERTDAERADDIVRAHAERMAEPLVPDADDADSAPAPAVAPTTPPPADEQVLPAVDVHTLDLF